MKKISLAIFIALLAVYGCQQKDEPKPQFQPPIGQPGQSGPVQGFDQAKILQEAVQKDPKNLNAWIQLGNLMMDTQKFNEAVNAYAKALELDPKNVDVRVDYGTCLRNSGKPEDAVREYKKALELNPNHMNANINMGVVLEYDLKDYKQALKSFEKALQIQPNAPNAPQLKAEVEKLRTLAK
jgi:cytochrome c-type biogenesis protein CcmH/NrfG